MELAQKYIDLLLPHGLLSKRDQAEKQGWSKGVAFDGSRAIEFLYRNRRLSTSRPAYPVYTHGDSQVGILESIPAYEFEMEILLDDNEVFMMFNKQTLPLDMTFESFIVEGAVSASGHHFQSSMGEDIISRVSFHPIRRIHYI